MIYMDQNFFSRLADKTVKERIALISALVLSLIVGGVLAVAAWGKFFYPSEFMKNLDQWVSGFEILFIIAIFVFRKRWQLWLVSATVFAGWYGYALYSYLLELPCKCMGAMLNIPTVFSLTLDLIFFSASLALAFLLGARARWIYFGFLAACMAAIVGYAFADWIYGSIVNAK